MPRRSITLNYLLWTWGFFLLVLSAVFLFATGQAERAVLAEAEVRARHSLDLAAYLLRAHPPFGAGDTLAAYVDGLGPHLGFRLTYIVDGRVAADSEVGESGVPDMENHADRPEVRAARQGELGQDLRLSRTLGRDMLYVAKALPATATVPAGIVRLALPVSALRGEIGRGRETLLGVLALIFVAGGLAAYLLARRMSGSIREFSQVAAAIGNGHFDQRIHIVPATDFAPLAEALNTLAARIGSHVGEIEERRQRQETIFEGMAEGLAILDASGRIVGANRAFREMFPKIADPVGRTLLEAGAPLCVDRALSGDDGRQAAARRIGRFELPSARVVEVTAAPVSGAGQGRGSIVTFHDVTEAAAMDHIFRDFVIDASHNLRTPLTKVLGFGETARDQLAATPPDVAGAGAALDVVVRSAGAMKTVIDELLTAARDRFAAAKAKAPATDALAALKQALAGSVPILRAKGVTARLIDAPDGPVGVGAAYDVLVRFFAAVLAQTPDAVSIAISLTREEGDVLVRFQGPASLGLILPDAELAAAGGKAFLDGATRVVRLPQA
ncbi:HAMP domain-containing protein [Desulfovibrio aerotolerans]|uniref:histidine kinase n=1 Tax=Solidesulfovibrio aerotolerans TaxID=295255 RepID=A0A7C9MFN1_9BACT|nr:HAMP domain-containing protein [Solidesulfovibrio aerotolerans]MYL83630.1 HAMP domain-containing protein [Solidesulfovibrio aerotolerans]